jgi:hypothetical protein
MSDQAPTGHDDLDLVVVRHIDAACRRFEAEWRVGSRPAIDNYLADVPDEGRPAMRA